jgi:histone acetyltransferase (RNA polymerase elongator complex component)
VGCRTSPARTATRGIRSGEIRKWASDSARKHELRQIQRREEEAHAERVKQVTRRKSEEEERRNAKKRARNTWRTWLGEHDDFAKARDGLQEFARGIWRAHKDVREDVGPHLLSMLNVSSM